jgi:hypothetical protein
MTRAPRPLTPEQLERFVYLVGSPRGGTTVIMRAFYLSDRVFPCPNPTHFTHQVWKYRNKVDSRLLRQIFKLPKFYREGRTLKALDPAELLRIRRLTHNAFATRNLGRMYQLYPLLHSLDVACTKEPERALCWADKANDVYGLLDIPRSLPKAKFIFIIRDPRATIASMTGQAARTREKAGLPPGQRLHALIAGALYWRNMMQTFLRFGRRYPDRTLFIRYEDFVQEPERSINRLLDFAVGEAMPEETLRAGLSQFPHKTKHDRSAHGRGIDVRPLERWRRMLTGEEIELATALTWRTARKLGYEIDAPWGRFPTLSALSGLKGWRSRAASSAKLGYLALMEWATPRAATSGQGDNA